MLKPPCKDCIDRKVGCHSTCEKYIAYDEERKRISSERAKFRQVENDLVAIQLSMKKRDRKNENNSLRR